MPMFDVRVSFDAAKYGAVSIHLKQLVLRIRLIMACDHEALDFLPLTRLNRKIVFHHGGTPGGEM
jgi:hypothetical protein